MSKKNRLSKQQASNQRIVGYLLVFESIAPIWLQRLIGIERFFLFSIYHSDPKRPNQRSTAMANVTTNNTKFKVPFSGGASSEKSERNGGDFDVIFQSKGIPN